MVISWIVAEKLLIIFLIIPGPKISKPAVNNNYPLCKYSKTEFFMDVPTQILILKYDY